jgi:trigger factor
MTDTEMTDTVTTDAAIEASNPLERRIEMTVVLAEIEKDVDQRLKQMSRTVKMPGFRPGKVPMKMVAQQYGAQARSDAIGAAVETAYGEKVQEQKLRVAGYPRIEPKSDVGVGQLGFTAVFEVYPDIIPADISGQAIEKPTLTVTDAEVDKTIEVLRKQRTVYEATDGASARDDRLVIDFVGRKNGEEFPGGKASDYSVMVGGGMMLPDFEAQMVGVKAGDSKSFDVAFPEGYQAANLAGKTAQFDIKVKKVEAPKLPEIDGEFAKSLGILDGDVAKMRTEIQANVEREVKKRLQARNKNQVMEALLAANPIDVPKALVDAESQQMAEAAKRDFESRGMPTNNMPFDPTWFTDGAIRRVKLGLLLAELVNSKELQAKAEQVRTVVDEFAATFEDPQQVVRWYYGQPERLQEAQALATENNVMDYVLSVAKVTEKSIDFDELMGNAA